MPARCVLRDNNDLSSYRQNYGLNDVVGNFSLTLLDVLDTFVVLDDHEGFEHAVRNAINYVSFDVNTRPQVFETTIRVLGGLLSGHIFASDTKGSFYLHWYRSELLQMAYDLGQRYGRTLPSGSMSFITQDADCSPLLILLRVYLTQGYSFNYWIVFYDLTSVS